MGKVKQLWMDQMDEYIEAYFLAHPDADDEEAVDAVIEKGWRPDD